MKNFARIENGRVAERLNADELPPFHPSLHWEKCPAETQIGWEYDGAVFSAPVVELSAVIAGKLHAINTACENAIAAIQAGCPVSEVLSWPKQEAEARSYVADPGAATPLIDALAEARGINKAELARRVILKADAFAQYLGTVIGKRQGLEDALNALPADATVEQIAAIAW